MAGPLFELKGAGFSYLAKFPGVNQINLTIEPGESIAILGANGSGKSTLLSILAGLIYPEAGTFTAFGRLIDKDVFDNEDFRREFRSKVGFLFQNSEVQLFSPTVEEELYFGPLQLDLPREAAEKIIEGICAFLDIKKLLKRSPHQLSVGEKKKVAIASILVINPEVLLLDEPLAGLDPRTCRELIGLIAHYRQQGKTIVTATHDLHVIADIADKIYILNEEKTIVASGECAEILSDQSLLHNYNLLHIHTHQHKGAWHKHSHQHSGFDESHAPL